MRSKKTNIKPYKKSPRAKSKNRQMIEQALINQQTLMNLMLNLKQQQNATGGSLNPFVDPFMSETKINLVQFLDRFLAECDIAQTSKKTYKGSLLQFFKFHEEKKGNARPTREMVLQFKEYCDFELGLKPTTRGSYLVGIRMFFSWLEQNRLYPDVSKSVKNPRRVTSHHAKDSLSIPNLKKLFMAMPRGDDEQDSIVKTIELKRNLAVISLMLRTGCRISEVRHLNIGDVDNSLGDGQVFAWIRGKGRSGKDERVFFSEQILSVIQEYLDVRYLKDHYTDTSALFASVSDRNFGKRLSTFSLSRIIKNYFIMAGVKTSRISAHSLRHTFGVLSIKSGVSLFDVQLAMRHTNPATTQVYLGDIKQSKRLEAVSEKKLNKLLDDEGIK